MKNTRFIWIGLIVCLFSCTREEESSEMLSAEADMEFTAIWAEQDDTRTLLQGDDGEIWWSPSEQINVFYGNAYSGQFTSTNSAPAAVTQFRGKLDYFSGDMETSSAPMSYWAVYPYDAANTCDGQSVTLRVPDVQTGVAESFADKFFPAIAQSGGADLAFYNVCGGARFSLVTPGVEKVVFRSVDGSPMAGVVRIGFSDAHKPVVLEVAEPLTSIVVNAPDGGFIPGTHYFATMLPQTHAEGLEIQLLTSYKSANRMLDKSVIVRRSTLGLLEDMDEGLNWHYLIPEMVDLGLSVKWASFNVGASAPEEYGNYFAWGETEPKEDYSWSTYKWCMNGNDHQLTKYCTESSYGYNGFTDNKTVLDSEDDAAAVNLGGSWRMPTAVELGELHRQCTWRWTTLNRVNGYKVTSNKGGYTDKWIFLPAAGSRDGTSLGSAGSWGYYWFSSLNTVSPSKVYYVYFYSNDVFMSYGSNRYLGRSVRPVYDDTVHATTGVGVSPGNATVGIGEPAQLTAIVSPPNATDKRVTWSSSDASVATVDADGLVTGISAGSAVITAITVDGGFTAECAVTVVMRVTGVSVSPEDTAIEMGKSIQLTAMVTPSNATDQRVTWSSSDASVATVDADGLVTGISAETAMITATTVDGGFTATCTVAVNLPVPEAVDLGLSVKWASWNVGASAPEEYGDYFAWGETKPKDIYSLFTYKWCNFSASQLTKYCNNSNYGYNGFMDNKTILDPKDDAAAANWGGSWRMPTKAEQDELRSECTWTWTTLNGVYGRKVTSNKSGYTNKWIFFPAAGYRNGTSLGNAGSYGYYWSSSLYTDSPSSAYYVYFRSDGVNWSSYYGRCYGQSVRPVSEY